MINSTQYVETAVSLHKGAITVESLMGQKADLAEAARRADDCCVQLQESADPSSICEGLADIQAVQSVMRAFGVVKNPIAEDFSLGSRIASVSNLKKLGVVIGVGVQSNMVEVCWDGPQQITETVAPTAIVRRGKADDLKIGLLEFNENGVAVIGESAYRISDPLIRQVVAGRKANVTKGRSAHFVVFESNDGITITSPLVLFNEREAPEKDQDYARMPEAEEKDEDPAKNESLEDLRKTVSEAIMSCTGDPSDAIKLAKLVSESIVDQNWEQIIEQSIVSFAKQHGHSPLLSAVSKTVSDAVQKTKLKLPKIPFQRPLPSKIKPLSDLSVPSGKRVNVTRVSDMLDRVQRAIAAAKLVRVSNTTAAHRSLAKSIYDMFRIGTINPDEPWVPFKVITPLQTEHTTFIETKDELLSEELVNEGLADGVQKFFRMGQRTNLTVQNPLSTPGTKKPLDADTTKKDMEALEDLFVGYRATLQRLMSQPTSTQLARRAANQFLAIMGMVSTKGDHPWSIVGATGVKPVEA